MISVKIPSTECFDSEKEEFIIVPEYTLLLEHSLLSISKWESKHHKAFLSMDHGSMANDELVDYIRCMTINTPPDDYIYLNLTNKNYEDILHYIEDPMTATYINEPEGKGKGGREIITSEIIYYWMVANQIPFSCEKWHINRLLMLIRVCGIKNQPDKKMSKADAASRYRSTMAARRAKKPH